MSMWGDILGRNAEPDPDEWEPLTEAEEWGRRTLAEQLGRRHEYDAEHQGDAQADEARARRDHFTADAGQLAPHDYQCDDGCEYEADADRDARIDHEEECDRLREAELRADSLGVCDGQPVMEGDHGRLVYDAEPTTADGCIVPCPPDFLGIPHQLEPALGAEHDWEAGS